MTSAEKRAKMHENRRFHLSGGNGCKIWTVYPKSMYRYSNESSLDVEYYAIGMSRWKCDLACFFEHWIDQILKIDRSSIIWEKIEIFQKCYFFLKISIKIHFLSKNHAIWSIFVDFIQIWNFQLIIKKMPKES